MKCLRCGKEDVKFMERCPHCGQVMKGFGVEIESEDNE